MTNIRPKSSIRQIAPYKGGDAKVAGVREVIKLSSNENPFGPSEKAVEAWRKSGHELHRYPPSDHKNLIKALADQFDLEEEGIICGNGSDEVISLLCQAYVGEGDEVIHTEHGFSMYRISTLAAGGTPVEVKERGRLTDVDAILEACNERTKLVFIANPNNPTGTMIGGNEVGRLAAGLPPQCLLVLDGAYADYVENFDGGAGLVESRDNVVMTRTFSKLYGLGGLRVGWGYAPKKVVDVLMKIRPPFNLSRPQLDTAEAALKDQDHITKCRNENARLRAWLAEALAEHGVMSDTSCANFILARFGSEAEANACDAELRKEGLIVRKVGSYNLPNCLRITIGDEPSCRRVAHVIGRFKEGGAEDPTVKADVTP